LAKKIRDNANHTKKKKKKKKENLGKTNGPKMPYFKGGKNKI
jgi:hypothetical protein